MLRMVIDRFEGNTAIVEIDGEIENYFRSELPPDAKEGDVIIVTDEGNVYIDIEETNALKSKARKIMNRLWED